MRALEVVRDVPRTIRHGVRLTVFDGVLRRLGAVYASLGIGAIATATSPTVAFLVALALGASGVVLAGSGIRRTPAVSSLGATGSS